MKEIKLFIPGSPMSANKLYTRQRYNRRKVILTNEARSYKTGVWLYLEENYKKEARELKNYFKTLPTRLAEIEIFSSDNWFTKESKPKKKDVQNQTKALVDTVFDFFGLDDSLIFDHRVKKVHTLKKDKIGVSIYIRLVPLENFLVI